MQKILDKLFNNETALNFLTKDCFSEDIGHLSHSLQNNQPFASL